MQGIQWKPSGGQVLIASQMLNIQCNPWELWWRVRCVRDKLTTILKSPPRKLSTYVRDLLSHAESLLQGSNSPFKKEVTYKLTRVYKLYNLIWPPRRRTLRSIFYFSSSFFSTRRYSYVAVCLWIRAYLDNQSSFLWFPLSIALRRSAELKRYAAFLLSLPPWTCSKSFRSCLWFMYVHIGTAVHTYLQSTHNDVTHRETGRVETRNSGCPESMKDLISRSATPTTRL